MSKFFLSRRRAVAAGVAIATIIGFSAASTIATTAPANATKPTPAATMTLSAPSSMIAGATTTVSATVTGNNGTHYPTGDVTFGLYKKNCSGGGNGNLLDGPFSASLSGAANPQSVTSPTFTAPTTPDSYYWGVRYPGDSNNGEATAICTSFTVTAPVNTAPQATTNPSNTTVTAGSSASFTAAASGSPSPTVQWQVSTDNGGTWNNVSGATSTTLSFSATSDMSGNQYRAVFTNSAGTTTTSAATLTVQYAPQVTTNPDSQSVIAGASVTFTAAASGNPSPTVQWQVSVDNGGTWTDVSGASSTTLTVPGTTVVMNGYEYHAVFTNSVGSATTTAAMLTVNAALAAPVIGQDGNPVDLTVAAGQTATFQASATGNPDPTVQWEVSKNGGATWTKLSNKTDTTLTFTAKKADDGNQYHAVFTNPAGSVTSSAATLTVTSAPTVTDPSDVTVIAGKTATFKTKAAGNPKPSLQWQVNKADGSGWTDLAGETGSKLTVATDPSMNGYQYRVVADGTVTSGAATLTVDYAPTVTMNPTDPTTVAEGTTATFTAAASGNPTPSVQWQQLVQVPPTQICIFGVCIPIPGLSYWQDIPGATSASLTLNNVTLGMDGNLYRAVFTNSVLPWIAITKSATLHVTAPVALPAVSFTAITACGTDGSITEPTADHVTFSIEGGDWAVTQGTYTITATPDNGYALVQSNGWSVQDDGTATLQVNLGDATICTAPVTPTVTQAACTGPGSSSPATVIPADTKGVTYAVAGDLSTVTATLQSGYQWQKDLPAGWVSGPENTMVYHVTLIPAGACLVNATPVTPTAQAGTCDLTTGFDSPAAITSPVDKQDADGITYFVSGLTVTAAADPGYQITSAPTGWVTDGGIWTYTADVTQPFCPSVVALPGSVPGTPDGTLTGVPGTTNPGQQLDVTGTGFAPGATVNFGIYSTPLLLATVSADASGVAKATVVIPADFIGDHTVVAAGSTPAGAPQFLAAKTTVVKKVTPAGNGGGLGVGGVSTSRGPGGAPNGGSSSGGSSSGLANTGTRENPIALVQIALLALLAGAGLLVIGRRRARKH